jgi:hypothetical protein
LIFAPLAPHQAEASGAGLVSSKSLAIRHLFFLLQAHFLNRCGIKAKEKEFLARMNPPKERRINFNDTGGTVYFSYPTCRLWNSAIASRSIAAV